MVVVVVVIVVVVVVVVVVVILVGHPPIPSMSAPPRVAQQQSIAQLLGCTKGTSRDEGTDDSDSAKYKDPKVPHFEVLSCRKFSSFSGQHVKFAKEPRISSIFLKLLVDGRTPASVDNREYHMLN